MQLHKIAFAGTHSFSSFFLDYIHQQGPLQKFYNRFPTPSNFKAQFTEKSKSFPASSREVLVGALMKQYKDVVVSETVSQNIASLSSTKTFTVTTGHQLNLFTGPLYFIYKIVTVINTCKKLKALYPDYHFVPVYWMASEDHDFEEISYFRLYGKKYVWDTQQTGAVGRFNPQTLKSLLQDIPGEISLFKDAYLKSTTLADAVRLYVNEIFGNEGLIVLDADVRELKRLLTNVIQDDVLKNTPFRLVEETNQQLKSSGYHPQVHPREINFFYLDKNIRNRIEKDTEDFSVVDTSLKFSKEDINRMVENEPEKFSPNVILRPLFQEMILPNLAYVGGPAELVYWLQLKSVFDHAKVPFPILLPRNFAMVLDKPTWRKFQKIALDLKDLFEDKNHLFNRWVKKNSSHDLSLGNDIKEVTERFNNIRQRAEQIDKSLKSFVAAEAKRALTSMEKIEKKMLKAEKRLHDDKLKQIGGIKDTLFPNGGLQERTDNFLNFYQQDPLFIKKIMDLFDPFDFQFNLIVDDE